MDRDAEGRLLEAPPQGNPAELIGGYAQSKWVSEKLLSEGARRGIGVTIFRPGLISGRSDSGAWANENDHLWRVVKGCVQMGYAPESDLAPNITPVDFVSAAIVALALTPHETGQIFNLANPNQVSWRTIVSWLQELGYPLQVVSNDVWRTQHLRRIDRDNALFPILPLYLGGNDSERGRRMLSKLEAVRTESTAQILSRLDMQFPVIDRTLWTRYVRFMQNNGGLPLPH